MFLHEIDFDKFDIACEDTLTAPQHWDDEPFELAVANPPYSIKWVGDDNPLLINDPRFAPAGVVAPKSKADMAFIMHSLSWLASNGTAAIVCFPGIMYRGGAEQKIRKYLIIRLRWFWKKTLRMMYVQNMLLAIFLLAISEKNLKI
jgi:type I restriction enzyme M protein